MFDSCSLLYPLSALSDAPSPASVSTLLPYPPPLPNPASPPYTGRISTVLRQESSLAASSQ